MEQGAVEAQVEDKDGIGYIYVILFVSATIGVRFNKELKSHLNMNLIEYNGVT